MTLTDIHGIFLALWTENEYYETAWYSAGGDYFLNGLVKVRPSCNNLLQFR